MSNTKPDGDIGAKVVRLARLWLLVFFSFSLGIYLYDRELWPYGLIQDTKALLDSDDDGKRGVNNAVAKLSNDLGGVPHRHLVTPRVPFEPVVGHEPVGALPLRDVRALPTVYLAPEAAEGYRLLHGTFAFDEALHGVILLAPDGSVLRHWEITQEDVDWNHRPDTNINPHGIDINREGAIFLAFDGGTSLRRMNWCGTVDWITMGGFHHSVDLNEDGALWTWGQVKEDRPFGAYMLRIDPATGSVLDSIPLSAVVAANPDIDIFAIRQKDTNTSSTYEADPWHANDVEALSARQAQYYEQLDAGDLLVSLRSLNLVFVMDPETLAVKWWRQGLVRRQHDPDFNDRGTVSIYDNNMHRAKSRIVDLDPVTYAASTVVAGDEYDFYSWRRGKHQELPNGNWLVTSAEQGRAFEVGTDGQVQFEFLNHFDDRRLLTIAEALWLPTDYFSDVPDCEGLAAVAPAAP